MVTEPTNQDVIATPNAEQKEPQTFTQEDVNRIVAKRVSKYSDYEELKEKAAKFDAAEEASKTELQKAQEKAAALEAELENRKKADALRVMREEVSKETGVPAALLTGATEDECRSQANGIIEFKSQQTGYPVVKDGGEVTATVKGTPKEQFKQWASEVLG